MALSLPPTATTGAAYALTVGGISLTLDALPIGYAEKNPYGFNRKARRALKADMRREARRIARAARRAAW